MNPKLTGAAPAPDLRALLKLREDMADRFNPADSYESMLVGAIAEAWFRLEQAYADERGYRAGRDMVEVITTKLDEYKAVTRHVTDCERAWRHAIDKLEKAQRTRERTAAAGPAETPRPAKRSQHAAESPAPGAPPAREIPDKAAVAVVRRE